MPQTDYAGLAPDTQLVGNLTGAAGPGTVITLLNGTGYPTGALGVPFVITLDGGTSAEEKVLCSVRSGNNITIASRGYDDTIAVAHSACKVQHTVDAAVLRVSSAHVYDTARDDHGQYIRGDGGRDANKIRLVGTVPTSVITMRASNASADLKAWRWDVTNGQLQLWAMNDAESGGALMAGFVRTGATNVGRALNTFGPLSVADDANTATVVLQPHAGGSTSTLAGRVEVSGDENGMLGKDNAGTNKFLFGLRKDITGNANDVVLWPYVGGFSVYPAGLANRAFKIQNDGTVAMEVAASGAIGAYGMDVKCSSQGGFTTIRAKSNWAAGGGTGYFAAENSTNRLFEIDGYGRISFPSASSQGPIVTATASAGGATLPANPVGFLMVQIDGTTRKLPYYAA